MIELRTNVKTVVVISISTICVCCAHAKFPSQKLTHSGRDCFKSWGHTLLKSEIS